MASVYDKYYYERYALLAVCHLLNLDLKDFAHADRPDIQSKKHGIGIEVVRAISEDDAIDESYKNKLFGRGLPGEEIVAAINREDKRGNFKGRVHSFDGVASISSKLYHFDEHRQLIDREIQKKTRRLPSYTQYDVNGLYCFAHTSLFDEGDYPGLLEACRKGAFDVVFIDCIDKILQWRRVSPDIISENHIPEGLLGEWKLALRGGSL